MALALNPTARRALKLRDLVFYGIVLITPLAPVGVFGVASQLSHGHAAATIVIAMMDRFPIGFWLRWASCFAFGSGSAGGPRLRSPHGAVSNLATQDMWPLPSS